MTARERAKALLDAREAFPVGSLDWQWMTRAAWTLDQIDRGIPARDWTAEPPAQSRKAA